MRQAGQLRRSVPPQQYAIPPHRNRRAARRRHLRFGRLLSSRRSRRRLQAICDFVHRRIEFGHQHARRTRTAWEAYNEGRGVCRDHAHLAIAFCCCMNIPARYCTGYLGDMGTEPPCGPMDFAGWFEAYPGDRWFTFDVRNNTPRSGRVLIARGRDA